MLDSARRMAGLVDDLLAIAVASSGGTMLRLASVPAAALASSSVDAVRPLLAARSLRLELKLEDKLPPINVDADRILRVLANLLDNAMKFTAEGGRIALAVRSSADGVKYSVENSGPALTREELDAMFQPFWQAKRDDVRGTGLGLSICRSIVEAHGGSIWAEPAEGQRVRVNFLLPRRPASAPEPTPKHFS
jgi:signal transduction histidine kinase